MDNPVVEQLGKWAKREMEQAEHQQYINQGKQQAYRDMVEHINQTCMECGEYFYSLDRLAEHQADKHPEVFKMDNPVVEAPTYGDTG